MRLALVLALVLSGSPFDIWARSEKPHTLTVTLRVLNVGARVVSLHACRAEQQGEGIDSQLVCAGDWERESTQETSPQSTLSIFDWRSVPTGHVILTAAAFDGNGKLLARVERRAMVK